jgi:6-phospho-3-hexuloisomerase
LVSLRSGRANPTREQPRINVTAGDESDASVLLAARGEVSGVLSAVSGQQLADAARLLADRGRRWFFCGQGRSGLVAQVVAMRLMHVGYEAHVVGEATTPSIADGDRLMAFSGSGETPVTLHLARLAHELGAQILAVTTRADSTPRRPGAGDDRTAHLGHTAVGGTLFEQRALLVLDALAMKLTEGDPGSHALMQARHANLQ